VAQGGAAVTGSGLDSEQSSGGEELHGRGAAGTRPALGGAGAEPAAAGPPGGFLSYRAARVGSVGVEPSRRGVRSKPAASSTSSPRCSAPGQLPPRCTADFLITSTPQDPPAGHTDPGTVG
jgi:hypothetical protein